MNVITWIMLGFSLLGAFDRLIGNRLGLGKEFERGFQMLGTLALAMIGMIVISPFLAELMSPVLNWFSSVTPFDPSVITASIFANDMGGAPLCDAVAKDPQLGSYNGMIVGAMMGCTVSFTIPFSLSAVKKENHRQVLLGLLCGVVTIPVGCFAGGLVAAIPMTKLLLNLLPLLIFSILVALGLFFIPNVCVKIFSVLGVIIKGLITVGLAIGILHLLTGYSPIKNITPLMEGAEIVVHAAVVMTGAFPLISLLSRLLKKPLEWAGKKLRIQQNSVMGFLTSLATSSPMFCKMDEMDPKGMILNSAFAVSGAFLFTDHLAFTMTYLPEYLPAVLVSKVVAGGLALAVAFLLCKREFSSEKKE